MRHLARAVVSAAALFTTSVFAQLGAPTAPMPQIRKEEGPSLEQTVEWLQGKFAAFQRTGRSESTGSHTTRAEMLVAGCVATFIRRQEIYDLPDGSRRREYKVHEVPLANVKTIETSAWGFRLETHEKFWGMRDISVITMPPFRVNGRNLTRAEWDALARVPDLEDEKRQVLAVLASRQYPIVEVTSASMPAQDAETAERIANALRHASGICKQRAADEVARAAAKKPRELF